MAEVKNPHDELVRVIRESVELIDDIDAWLFIHRELVREFAWRPEITGEGLMKLSRKIWKRRRALLATKPRPGV